MSELGFTGLNDFLGSRNNVDQINNDSVVGLVQASSFSKYSCPR